MRNKNKIFKLLENYEYKKTFKPDIVNVPEMYKDYKW